MLYMKFFIPGADDDQQAENVYSSIKQAACEATGWSIKEKRIFNIEYYHNGKKYYAEVGKEDSLIGELVVAIIESNTYLICTVNRGVLKGVPIMVGKTDTITHTLFEAQT